MTKLLYFLGLTLLLIGCSDENIKINPINGVWDKNNTQKFEIKIRENVFFSLFYIIKILFQNHLR